MSNEMTPKEYADDLAVVIEMLEDTRASVIDGVLRTEVFISILKAQQQHLKALEELAQARIRVRVFDIKEQSQTQ